MRFFQAVEFCRSRGMSLTKVYHQKHQVWLSNFALNISRQELFWIGLTYHHDVGKYLYLDKSTFNYSNWFHHYPDNRTGEEFCTAMYYNKLNVHHLWDDRSCRESLAFICESNTLDCGDTKKNDSSDGCHSDSCSPNGLCIHNTDRNSSNSAICKCDANYFGEVCEYDYRCNNYGHKSYLFINTRMRFNEARDFCESKQMSLIKVYDHQHLLWLSKITVKLDMVLFWIGLTYQPDKESFVNIDGSKPFYINWAHTFPRNETGLENCVSLDYFKGNPHHFWTNLDCRISLAMVCESRLRDCQEPNFEDESNCTSLSCSPYGKCQSNGECLCDAAYTGSKCEIHGKWNIYSFISKLLPHLETVITIIGLAGNCFNCYYFIATNKVNKFARKLLLGISIFDSIALITKRLKLNDLYTISLNNNYAFNIVCKFTTGLKYLSSDISVLLLEVLAIERLFAVVFPLHIKTLCSAKVKIIVLIISHVYLIGKSVVIMIEVKYEDCAFYPGFGREFIRMNSLVFQMQQTVALLISNIIILIKLNRRKKLSQDTSSMSKRSKKTVSLMIGLSILSFLLCTPELILDVLLEQFFHLMNLAEVRFYESLTRAIFMINHAVNFFFYLINSDHFRAIFLRFITCGTKVTQLSESYQHSRSTTRHSKMPLKTISNR